MVGRADEDYVVGGSTPHVDAAKAADVTQTAGIRADRRRLGGGGCKDDSHPGGASAHRLRAGDSGGDGVVDSAPRAGPLEGAEAGGGGAPRRGHLGPDGQRLDAGLEARGGGDEGAAGARDFTDITGIRPRAS